MQDAKELFLRCVMSGSFNKWLSDKQLSGTMLPDVKSFRAECEVCRELVAQSRPDLIQAFPGRPRPTATALAYAVMELEDACLVIAEEKFAAHGMKVRALMFDGCLVSGGGPSTIQLALGEAEQTLG